VRAIEHLGAGTVALLAVEGHQLHVLLGPADRPEPGATTTVTARRGSLMYFDAAGNRFEAPRAPATEPAKECAHGS
jgi:hypothetical protein